jgi:hypothetical protein
MDDPWDLDTAEDLVEGYLSDLAEANPNGLPMNPDRAADANGMIREGLAVEDADLLERGLREAERAWREAPAEGYPAPDYPDGPDE